MKPRPALDWPYRSRAPELAWPAFPATSAAQELILLMQLEYTQWLPPDRLLEHQLRQLSILLHHAYRTVPYYRERWRDLYDPSQALTLDGFSALPVLGRRDLQERFEALRSSEVPAAHGSVFEARTSGSTGMPVRIHKTGLVMLFWQALTLREHAWHGRDLRGKLAAIRRGGDEGEFADWGLATGGVLATGPSAVLGVRHDVDAQLSWLSEQQPDYLLTYPSNLAALAKRAIEQGVLLPHLREARTFGELLHPDVPELCRQAWQVSVADMYSAEEVGYVAFQCPEHHRYHVQAESALVQIIDEYGRPCLPGETGRVVVTPFTNFAMPLVRYDIGDFAEVGEPCACGRGLPMLRRVVGRVRNMLITSSGRRFWPALGTRGIDRVAPVRQYQLVQKTPDWIEARVVAAAPLSSDQEDALRRHFLSRLPGGFRMTFAYMNDIPRSAGGKFEDFVSEVAN